MAITNITTPEQIALARQPLRIGLTSNLPTDGRPINALRLRVTGSPAVGETLQITFGDVSETITVQTAADNSGNTISVQGIRTLAEYANLLVEELQKNYSLHTTFLIEYILGADDFVYLSPRTDRTPTWVFTDGLSNIQAENILSVNSVYQPNPGAVLLVEKYNATTAAFEEPIRHDLPLIFAQQEVLFDIQADFDLRHHLPPVNTIGSAGSPITACTDNIQRYQVRYADRAGRPSQVQGLTRLPENLYALYATNSFFSQYATFWLYWQNNGRFLTTQPTSKVVTVDQPEWLYWLGRNSGTINVRVTATQRSGATAIYNRGGSTLTVGDCVLIKAGHTQLNLPDTPMDPIVSYVVQLTRSGDVISEAFTYKLSGLCGEYERYFLFGNSLGGCDTVRATGKFRTQLTTTGQQGQRVITPDVLTEGRGQDFTYNTRGRNSYEGSVGYRSAAYVAYLQELLLAPEAWIVDVMAQRFNPIIIEQGSIDVLKDGEDLFTLRFRYQHAWEERGLGVSDDGQRIILPLPNPDDSENLGG